MESKEGKSVIFAVTNCICHDQRIFRMAYTLEQLGCLVTVAGRHKGECCSSTQLPFQTIRFRMIVRKGFPFYAFFNIRLLFLLLVRSYDIVVSNDLDTLPACFLASRLRKKILVYDSHEYFTGVPELRDRKFARETWKFFEKRIFPFLKYVITVSDSISDLYFAEYGVRPLVVRNVPLKIGDISAFSRDETGISRSDFLLILQGTGINEGRGGEELISAIGLVEKVSLIVAGSGDAVNRMKSIAAGMERGNRIKFVPPVSRQILLKYTLMADAGISLDKDTDINYRFSLPNKIFDYIAAGIPVISSDLPEVSRIIRGYDCGVIVSSVSPEKIAAAVSELAEDPELHARLRNNALKASDDLNWEKESEKVKIFYEKVFQDC